MGKNHLATFIVCFSIIFIHHFMKNYKKGVVIMSILSG